jgi:uncharacterized protein YktB (UPF0637 family)
MRKTKTFKIEGNDKSFEVRELKVKEIIGLLQQASTKAETSTELFGLKEVLEDNFLPLVSNVTMDDIQEMTPSELEIVYNHFREVNKAFFDVARTTGFQEIAEELKKAFLSDFSALFASSSRQAIPGP